MELRGAASKVLVHANAVPQDTDWTGNRLEARRSDPDYILADSALSAAVGATALDEVAIHHLLWLKEEEEEQEGGEEEKR